MAFKEKRELKVYEMSGRDYKPTPTIMLKGQWLKELGFVPGEKMDVHCEGGKLTITLKNECVLE
ncbi:MAG: SymE family type I addiction module toxin [Anaerostipes sp.]|nr:SymE family type I addiction module toxin [Anaerostipes sp.]MDD3746442.1 SymE family type I addiction module toxin [Anaerostipes sp.]